MHEIVTLQFGQQANYVGTHYWNTQESYFTYGGQEESPVDHDISFRPGVGADGAETYTPRTLIYDLKGAFGTLRRENALYELQQNDNSAQQSQWSGRTASLQLPAIRPSPYQQALEQGLAPPQLTTETVRFWSDYNHIFHHPRSIVQLNEYELNSSLMPFEQWSTGEELFKNLDREHDLLDRDLRPFLEESDQLQGVQVLSSVDDAWGGFSAKYLERISDELGKGCRWIWALEDGKRAARERRLRQIANMAQSVSAINPSISMYLPLTSVPTNLPPYVSLDSTSSWHTSALQATVIESSTLPTRLRRSVAGRASFDELETILNNDGNRRIATASLSMDDPGNLENKMQVDEQHDSRMTNGLINGFTDEDHSAGHDALDISFMSDVTSTTSAGGRRLGRRTHVFSELESLRGQWKSETEILEANMMSRDPYAHGVKGLTHQTSLLFPVPSSFPPIFRFAGQPQKLAVRASLTTSTAVADRIRDLKDIAGRLVGLDDREALTDGLVTLAEEYEEGWSGSEDDDDD